MHAPLCVNCGYLQYLYLLPYSVENKRKYVVKLPHGQLYC